MQVENQLATTTLHIELQFVARSFDTLISGNGRGLEDDLRDHLAVIFREVVNTPDMSPGNEEQVNRRLGMDVFECHEGIVLVGKIGRLFVINDLTKQAILHPRTSLWPFHLN